VQRNLPNQANNENAHALAHEITVLKHRTASGQAEKDHDSKIVRDAAFDADPPDFGPHQHASRRYMCLDFNFISIRPARYHLARPALIAIRDVTTASSFEGLVLVSGALWIEFCLLISL
jgi:hypothetical protein